MSAVPQTIEEAVAALQKIIQHPTSLAALKRSVPVKAYFEYDVSTRLISSKLAHNLRRSLILKKVGGLYVYSTYVGPIRNSKLSLVVFVESEIEDAELKFGLWNKEMRILSPITPSEISDNLEVMQYVVDLLKQKVTGRYTVPNDTHFI